MSDSILLAGEPEQQLREPRQFNNFSRTLQDFHLSLKKYNLWTYLAWNDLKQRYRGSILGPFWITMSMAILISALSVVYSRLLNENLNQYVPFLTTGFLVWIFVSTTLTESVDIFVNSRALILGIKLPYFLYIFRLIWRNFLIFLHNAVIYLIVLVFFHIKLTLSTLFFFPGMFLVILSLTAIASLFGLLGAKFRDLAPMVTSIIQVLFLVSPISWMPKLLGKTSLIIRLNPITYYLDLVRSPLLGISPNPTSWLVCLFITLFMFTLGFIIFAKCRKDLPYWL